ncbi:MAG: hypothetical protein RL204_310 [Bacteroidota bacterium]|jgi:uncharacterized membrane protein
MRKLAGYILNGVLVTVPIAIVVYMIYKILVLLSIPVTTIMESDLTAREKELVGQEISPIGILILLVVLFLIGFLWAKLISEPLKVRLAKWLDKIPMYKSIRDLMNAFVGSKKMFNKPVLVKLNAESEVEMIGFITDEDLKELGDDQVGKIGVYLPMSYSFSGHLVVVPRRNVKKIDRSSVDIMKYIVSGGIVEIETSDDQVDFDNSKTTSDDSNAK